MKILQNKLFVVLLAVCALGLVTRNLFWPLIKRNFPARTAASTASPHPKTPAAAQKAPGPPPVTARLAKDTTSPPRTPEPAISSMNTIEASSSASQWARAPKRDPFKVSGARSDGKAARDLLTLGGVLRQTQSTLVVLNNQVVAIGDAILGFKLETVEDHCVWVTGPNGREQVEFKYSLPPAPPKKNLSLANPSKAKTLNDFDRVAAESSSSAPAKHEF